MNDQVKMSQQTHRAVERLFPALFALRNKREPHPWELRLGEALIYGELTVTDPPRDPGLRAVHYVAEDVRLALSLHRLAGDEQPQA